MTSTPFFSRFFRALFGTLDLFRRVTVNVVFLVLVIVVVLLLVQPEPRPDVDQGVALVLNPQGMLVDEYDVEPMDRAINRLQNREIPQVRMRELVQAIEHATEDERVGMLVLDLSGLWPTGLSKLQDLHGPLQAFRDTGREVFAYSDGYGQTQYYLAAHADEIHSHPMGGVFIDGFGTWRVYMREALEKLSLDIHVFKSGEYKSFMEPYTRDDMSPEVREDTRAWLETLWGIYSAEVESMRGLDQGALQAYADNLRAGLEQAGGSLAQYALDAGLLDALSEQDEFEARVADIVGSSDRDGNGFRGITWKNYLAATEPARAKVRADNGDNRVAVLVMRGNIVAGDPGLGAVGAERMAEMIGRARRDTSVRALVVRIDSPGGSAYAADLIRRELERFAATDRPLVVSMSSVAASGGYWVATPADEIWAQPTTITGSIGVIAMIPTFPRTMERLGLNTDGIGTTRYSGAFRPDRPLGEDAGRILQLMVDSVYDDFLERVENGRGLEPELVHEAAQGRVWSGADAAAIGLVDELGSLEDAVAAAAARAGIEEYAVTWLERPLTFMQRMIVHFLDSSIVQSAGMHFLDAGERPLMQALEAIEREFSIPLALDDPQGIYMHCFCRAEPPSFRNPGGAARMGR